jgi:hypothetical protein
MRTVSDCHDKIGTSFDRVSGAACKRISGDVGELIMERNRITNEQDGLCRGGACGGSWHPQPRSSKDPNACNSGSETLASHIIHTGTDGQLRRHRKYSGSPEAIAEIFDQRIPLLTKNWQCKRILIYAPGALSDEHTTEQRLRSLIEAFLAHRIYPLIFDWQTDLIRNIEEHLRGVRRLNTSAADESKDAMLEPIAKGKARLAWIDIKENALAATDSPTGGARIAARRLRSLCAGKNRNTELHFVAHGAGSIFHALLLQLVATKGTIQNGPLMGQRGYGIPVHSVTLWAPACTVELFKQTYLPLVLNGQIRRLAVFTLDEDSEQADRCSPHYSKSLLSLISNALEGRVGLPWEALLAGHEEALLGMEKFLRADEILSRLLHPFLNSDMDWIISPNNCAIGSKSGAKSEHHADFESDRATLLATVARILRVDGLKVSEGAVDI